MGEAWVNALRGIAFALVAFVAVFGVLPAVVPPFWEEPPDDVTPPIAEAGFVRTAEDGVYLTDVVSALEPADADAEAEKDVAAPVPLAPEDALPWMYKLPELGGILAAIPAPSRE